MSAGRAENLKSVLEAVPSGYLVDAKWLTEHLKFKHYVNEIEFECYLQEFKAQNDDLINVMLLRNNLR